MASEKFQFKKTLEPVRDRVHISRSRYDSFLHFSAVSDSFKFLLNIYRLAGHRGTEIYRVEKLDAIFFRQIGLEGYLEYGIVFPLLYFADHGIGLNPCPFDSDP
jgi:hypothetical protein